MHNSLLNKITWPFLWSNNNFRCNKRYFDVYSLPEGIHILILTTNCQWAGWKLNKNGSPLLSRCLASSRGRLTMRSKRLTGRWRLNTTQIRYPYSARSPSKNIFLRIFVCGKPMMVRLKVDPVTISRRGSADLAILTTLFANYPSALRYSCPDQSCIIMQNWELHKKTVTVCHKIHPCHCILTNMNIQTSWVSLASVWYGRHFQLSEVGAFPVLLLNWARVWKTMLFAAKLLLFLAHIGRKGQSDDSAKGEIYKLEIEGKTNIFFFWYCHFVKTKLNNSQIDTLFVLQKEDRTPFFFGPDPWDLEV